MVIRLNDHWKPKVEDIARGQVTHAFFPDTALDALLTEETLVLDGRAIDADVHVGGGPHPRLLRLVGVQTPKGSGFFLTNLPPRAEHRQQRYLNNRAENSHQPMRQRERRMQRFKSAGHAQRFLDAYGPIASHFRPRRHRLPARAYRQEMTRRFQTWREITGTTIAA